MKLKLKGTAIRKLLRERKESNTKEGNEQK